MSRKQKIQQIVESLQPSYFTIEDETEHHRVPLNGETHFKLVIVASCFRDKTRVERHKILNNLLADEFKQGLHALSMYLYTPDEWSLKEGTPASPLCSKKARHTGKQ